MRWCSLLIWSALTQCRCVVRTVVVPIVCFRRLRGGVASFYGVRCGEDGDGAVLQKLRFVSGVVVFVVAAVAVQTVEARSRVAVLLMVAELVQPWLLREEEDGCAISGGGTGAVLVWRWWWRRRCCRCWWLPAVVQVRVAAAAAMVGGRRGEN